MTATTPVVMDHDALLGYVRKAAQKSKMTQADMARAIEADPAVVSRALSGDRRYTKALGDLARILLGWSVRGREEARFDVTLT